MTVAFLTAACMTQEVAPNTSHVVISGGPSTPPFSRELGYVYVIDLQSRGVVATVTGVGNDPYNLAVVDK